MLSLTTQSKKMMIQMASAILLLAAAAAAQTQPPCNTGDQPGTGTCGTLWPSPYNPETGGPKVDEHWQLATPYPSSPTNVLSGTPAQQRLIEDPCSAKFSSAWVDYPDGEAPAAIVYGYWSIDGPTSNWISPKNEVSEPDGLYIYRQTFTAPAGWTSPVTISGRMQSDNEVWSIYGSSPAVTGCQYLAGQRFTGSGYSGPILDTPTSFLTWVSFTTTHTFAVVPSATATIYFVVRNRQTSWGATTPAGLRVEFNNPKGSNLTQATGADLNGDGQTDVAVIDNGTASVAVYLNDGKGFSKDSEYPVGTNATSVAIGDVNGDGKPDLVVANNGSANVSVLLNTGKGTFQKAVNYAAGTNPVAVAIGDLNGDGKQDLVVASSENGSISILLGEGGGKFGAPVTASVGDPFASSPSAVTLADVNGDGKLDVLLADAGTGAVTVLLGNGDGTFGAPVSFTSEAVEPGSILATDLNGDGIPDVIIADPATASIYVMLGNGNGTFQPAVVYPAGSNPESLILVSPAGAVPSVAVADPSTSLVTVLQSNGDGTFQPGQTYPVGTLPVSVVSISSATGQSLAVVDNTTNTLIEVPIQ